jgi:hypothetical protein
VGWNSLIRKRQVGRVFGLLSPKIELTPSLPTVLECAGLKSDETPVVDISDMFLMTAPNPQEIDFASIQQYSISKNKRSLLRRQKIYH